MTARRYLGSALLVVLGAMIGIAVDRACSGRRPDLESGTTVTPNGDPYRSLAEGTKVVHGPKQRSEADPRSPSPAPISLEDAERLVRDALERPPSPERSRVIEEACSRLMAAEIPTASRMIERLLRREPEHDRTLRTIAARWAAVDPQGALSHVKERPSLPEPSLLGMLDEFAKSDPAAARDLLLAIPPTLPPFALIDRLTAHFAESWAGQDLPAALAWLIELPEGRTKNWAVQGMIESWSRANPRAAAAYFESAPGRHRAKLEQVAGIWAAKDPLEACAWAGSLPEGPSRSRVLGSIVSAWALNDPQEAWNFASSVDSALLSDDRLRILTAIASAWADTDVEGALQWFQKLSPATVPLDVVETLWSRLAEDDVRSAAAFLESLPPGPTRSGAMARLAVRWAHGNIEESLAWLRGLEGEEQRHAMEEVMETWAESDPQAVLSHVRRVPSGETRDALLARIIPAVALGEPDTATALTGELSGESAREQAVESIAEVWSETDPVRAAKWAESLPEGKTRKAALASIASAWADQDVSSAERWLTNLPPGESRDAAIMAFIDKIDAQDPGTASRWASRIEDPSERAIKLESLARVWLDADPPAARQWILNSPLPDEMKTQLLESSN